MWYDLGDGRTIGAAECEHLQEGWNVTSGRCDRRLSQEVHKIFAPTDEDQILRSKYAPGITGDPAGKEIPRNPDPRTDLVSTPTS